MRTHDVRGRAGTRRAGGFALAAVLVLAGSAFADDASARQRIEARLDKAGLGDQGQVEVAVDGGVAILSGFTTTVAGQREAEKAARKEAKTVENRIRVVPAEVEDADISQAVVGAVLGYVDYGVFDSVGVGVQDGVVTLKGSVLQPYRKQDIERLVSRLEGVTQIRNDIRVQPASTFDDRLRLQLYHQIYGSGILQRFGGMTSPPVHIVVENGNITLTGVVNSRVEKVTLEQVARGLLAFRVDNQIEVEGEAAEPRSRT
jgi:hyperosmotically inducible protein